MVCDKYATPTYRPRPGYWGVKPKTSWFRDAQQAGLPQCSAHGLRKLAATRLANAGCSSEQIKAITGHRSDSGLAP